MKSSPFKSFTPLIILASFLAFSCTHDDEVPRLTTISGITATPTSVSQGGTIELVVSIDAEGFASILWYSSQGELSDPQNDTTSWVAPDSPGVYTVSVVVTDDFGSHVGTIDVGVDTYVSTESPHYRGASSCTQCHSERVSVWSNTNHADAIATLEAIGQDENTRCLECHTVGYDIAKNNGGYDEIPVERLASVQCENCHGPASDHIANPSGSTYAGNYDANTCGQCHQDEHHPYLEEWEESEHATSLTAAGGFVTQNPSCLKCHVSEAFVAFIKTGSTPGPTELATMNPINCQSCHDPHSDEEDHQLRLGNVDLICGECHTSGSIANVDDPGEPHHPQWNMLHGTDGLEYDGITYNNSPHFTVVEGKCGSCHVSMEPYSSGSPAKTGHTFDAELRACTTCHPGDTNFDVNGVQTEITSLLAQLHAELDAATVADSATVAFKQALYNYEFVEADGSHGVHNYKYAKKLLESSIADFQPN